MKSSLISILILAAMSLSNIAEAAELRHDPDDSARILAEQVQTADLYVIESIGDWSRVVNTKTGLVAWTKMPQRNVDDDEDANQPDPFADQSSDQSDDDDSDQAAQDDGIITEENEEEDINGMVLALD